MGLQHDATEWQTRWRLRKRCGTQLWNLWAVLGILFCIILLAVIVGGVVLGVVAEVANLNWGKYVNSPRLTRMMELISVKPGKSQDLEKDHDYGALLAWAAKGPLVGVLG